jgi:hypothetical protein
VTPPAQHLAESFLGQPLAVGGAAIEEIDTGIQRSMRRLQRSILVAGAKHVTQRRSPVADNRHRQTGAA